MKLVCDFILSSLFIRANKVFHYLLLVDYEKSPGPVSVFF